MRIINDLILGVSSSFVASLFFTYIFTRIKPKLYISDQIAYSNKSYKIKVINRGRTTATNIRVELCYVNYFSVNGGRETNTKRIHITKHELFSLEGYNKKSEFATFTYRFVTNEDIRVGLLQKRREYIRFKITATHSKSNISKVFVKEYRANQIVDGDFAFGNKTKIHD